MKIQVGVIFGGKSVEHEVSIISGLQAFAALDRKKYDAIPVYISKQGLYYTGPDFGDIANYRDLPALLGAGTQIILTRENGRVALLRHPAKRIGNNVVGYLDVVIPVVHGTNVEDGTLQGFLESLGLAYTGPDVLSSAICMDKAVSKTLLQSANIPVLPALAVNNFDWNERPDDEVAQLEAEFSYPMIIKPVNLGSSVGISKAQTQAQLRRALDNSFKYAARALVEPSLVNLREINCAVLGDTEVARPSLCEEPIGGDEILSYQDKYLSSDKKTGGMSTAKRVIPADLTAELRDLVTELAVRTFQTLGCRGVARVDFLLDTDTGNLYVNEINPSPGSLAFYLWEPAGLGFSGLLDNMLALAFKRQRERRTLQFTYDTNILSGVMLGGKTGKMDGGSSGKPQAAGAKEK